MHRNFLLLVVCVIATIMMLGVFGLMACSGSLDDYKAEGVAKIDAHVATKTQSHYCISGWEAVCKAVADGKLEVNNATNRAGVDTAVEDAKQAIDEVEKEAVMQSIQFIETPLNLCFGSGPDISAIIGSRDGLETLLDEYSAPWADAIREYYKSEFFSNKKLIFYFAEVSSAEVSYSLTDIQLIGNRLVLQLFGEYDGNTLSDVMGYISFLIEVDNADIGSFMDFDVNIEYETQDAY